MEECSMTYITEPCDEKTELAFCNCTCKGETMNCGCNGTTGGTGYKVETEY